MCAALPMIMPTVVAATAAILMEVERRRRRSRRRRYWVHPILANRDERGQFIILYEDLRGHEDKFFNYTRMSITSFDELLGLTYHSLERQNTCFRASIQPAQRLLITLRYLATGNSFGSLHYEFKVGKSTISGIVHETCLVIWNVLKPLVFKKPTKEDWLKISDEFWERCNFPNCVGAIDGKHIRILRPFDSGSQFFNYKKYFSFVLMAVVDAKYNFIYIDVGAYGSSSDSGVFNHSTFGRMIRANSLDLPNDSSLPGTNEPALPFVFVGDEAFALGKNLLRPFSSRALSNDKRIFNYRLTRARRVVECAFGILANKWRILHTAINLSLEHAVSAVKTACALHNYVRERDGIDYEDSMMHNMEAAQWSLTRGTSSGKLIRDQFLNYFLSPAGELPWQMQAI
ncbi:protein ANTAGONIST OF LIKE HETEROCHROMATIN PROTEIN 1-like [Rana temporaria]|uniref:protein ANTAGONIST OF LIKE HETEROCHROMATIN PROTEIN 1-like n=1 Tax=Rana temporaria TaxID=8407 RepID=UPI001AADA8B3|nr:protein ANTAGONIST OF LIKE HETEROCHROMATIN PROTEIN 1-like [Rana temporaria]